MIILHTLHPLFLHFKTPCLVYSPNLDEVSVCFNFFGCCLLLMIFVASSTFLILSLNSSGLLCCMLRHMLRFFIPMFFKGS